jgi:hypothetical protein
MNSATANGTSRRSASCSKTFCPTTTRGWTWNVDARYAGVGDVDTRQGNGVGYGAVTRLAVVFLAFAVCAANAYCACTAAAGKVARTVAVAGTERQEHSHDCCARVHTSHRDGQRDSQGKHGGGDGHTCPHCTGTFTGDVATSKTAVAQPAPLPDLFQPVCVWVDADQMALEVRPACLGLPPPVEPPTLFHQSCLLTT